jgi:pimeloyl-ACP methyl ester carboxylesterase
MTRVGNLEATIRAELRALRQRAPKQVLCERHQVVLLHGWAGWSRQLLALEQYLAPRLGRRVVRAQFGRSLDCIRGCAERANSAIERFAERGPLESLDLVGFSMGGLVATELLKSWDEGRRVRSVVTLGTPHRGSPLARLGTRVLRGWSGSLVQMLPEAGFLRALHARPLPRDTALYSVAGASDLLVPPRYAQLPRRTGLHNLVLLGADHFGLALQPAAHRLVERLLRRQATSRVRAACDRCEREAQRALPPVLHGSSAEAEATPR